MGKIEIGEYVKIKDGYIDRVDGILGENTIHLEKTKWTNIKNIVKHSKNIIDLIEVGDYVNGELVVDIFEFYETLDDGTEKYCGRKLLTQYRMAQFKGTDSKYYIYQNDIKSIVTKQQFSNMEYRLEE